MCGYSIPWGKNWARSERHSSLLQTLKDCERWEEKENSVPLNSFYFFSIWKPKPHQKGASLPLLGWKILQKKCGGKVSCTANLIIYHHFQLTANSVSLVVRVYIDLIYLFISFLSSHLLCCGQGYDLFLFEGLCAFATRKRVTEMGRAWLPMSLYIKGWEGWSY